MPGVPINSKFLSNPRRTGWNTSITFNPVLLRRPPRGWVRSGEVFPWNELKFKMVPTGSVRFFIYSTSEVSVTVSPSWVQQELVWRSRPEWASTTTTTTTGRRKTRTKTTEKKSKKKIFPRRTFFRSIRRDSAESNVGTKCWKVEEWK